MSAPIAFLLWLVLFGVIVFLSGVIIDELAKTRADIQEVQKQIRLIRNHEQEK